MHILILENGVNIDNFVNLLRQNDNIGLIFASQDSICNVDDVTKIDIDSDEIVELLDFSLANEIKFVFALSDKALSTEIVELFKANGIMVFGSCEEQYEYLLNRSNTKKLIYKNKIPTLRFAVFEKQQQAQEWCKTAQYPILIMSDAKDEIKKSFCVDTYLKAQDIIETLFEQGFEKIVMQEAVEGHYFTSYYLTDSTSHVHLANFYNNDELSVCPDFQISQDIQDYIFNDFYIKILNSVNYNAEDFCGILKLDFVIVDENLYLLDVGAQFSIADFQVLLQILDVDIFDLFSSLTTGALEDFEGCNLLKDKYFAALKSDEQQPLFEDDDNVECIQLKENKFLYLAQASTVNRACGYLIDEV